MTTRCSASRSLTPGHPHDPREHGTLGNDQEFRRTDGAARRGADPARAHRRRGVRLGHRVSGEACLPLAEKRGVLLALENHWGLSRTVAALQRIIKAIDSPWLRALMDTGNFLEDPYDDLEALAPLPATYRPRPTMVAAPGTRFDLDYPRIARDPPPPPLPRLRVAGVRRQRGLSHRDPQEPADAARARSDCYA